jgi:primosomal protein N' (replication factor Y)
VSSLREFGIGTERIEAEVRQAFASYRIARMDSDTMKTRKAYETALQSFWKGGTDVLVGTQMIAKGMDVPNVTLVGVVSADTAFHLPDFRSAERTFQLVTQVAGRAGRGPKGGRVIVQTFNPHHYAITAAAGYDVAGFYQRELELRKELAYPPWSRLVRILLAGSSDGAVRHWAERLEVTLRRTIESLTTKVLGPAPAPLARLRARYRHHFLIKSGDAANDLPRLRELVNDFPIPRSIHLTVDVDPVSVL